MFEGRTAVITGGGTGIGAAVALALAEAGVSISLIGRRLERLQSVAARASGLGAKTACYPTDLADNSGNYNLDKSNATCMMSLIGDKHVSQPSRSTFH